MNEKIKSFVGKVKMFSKLWPFINGNYLEDKYATGSLVDLDDNPVKCARCKKFAGAVVKKKIFWCWFAIPACDDHLSEVFRDCGRAANRDASIWVVRSRGGRWWVG